VIFAAPAHERKGESLSVNIGWAPPAGADAGYARFTKDRRVVVDDGTPLAYTVLSASGDRTPVVFANGWSCSDAYWVHLAPVLAELGHPCVVLDTRGHGASGLPRRPGRAARNLSWRDLSMPRLADDLVAVLDDTALPRRGRAVIVGHSMGVQIALETYRRWPGRVAGLVLLAGPYENPLHTFYGGSLGNRIFPFFYLGARALPELLRPLQLIIGVEQLGTRAAKIVRGSGQRVSAAELGPYLRHLASRDPGFLSLLADAMRRHSAADVLDTIAVPTLILAAGRDTFCPPAVQTAMHERIRDSEIAWFDEGTHSLPIEEPTRIGATVTEFLGRRVD
jgi:3-oxoadipate enol-lactonase